LPGEIAFSNIFNHLLFSDFLCMFRWGRQGREATYVSLSFLTGRVYACWRPCGEHGDLA
jgi:hypothetical protein